MKLRVGRDILASNKRELHDDGDLASFLVISDFQGSLNAIHYWHLFVEEHHLIGSMVRPTFSPDFLRHILNYFAECL